MINKNKYVKILISIVISFLLGVTIEGSIWIYNTVVNKVFISKHYINNNSINIDKNDLNILHENGVYKLDVRGINTRIYNISLDMNEKNADVYMTININNQTNFMPKENAEATKFKIYFKNGIDVDSFSINFPDTQVSIENVKKIVINDNINYMPQNNFSLKRSILIGVAIYFVYVLYKIYKVSNKKENVFLCLAGIMGIILVFISAPQARYDEHAHYWRAYEIASGHIISSSSHELPTSVINLFRTSNGNYPNRNFTYSQMKEKLKENLNKEVTEIFPVGVTGSLTPISYMPQVVGIIIAKHMNWSPLAILWCGRLANLFLYLLVMFIAIKIIPNEKWKAILLVVGTLPMSLNLAATVSPDTIIISFTILAISYALHLKFEKEKINIIDIVLFSILCMIPTVCKIVYFPLLLLFFILPKEKFDGKIKRLISFVLALLIVFIPYYILNNIISRGDWSLPIRNNMNEQILFTVSSIPRLLLTIINTFYSESTNYFSEMIGGWNTITVISVIIFIMIMLITFCNFDKQNKYSLLKKDKIILGVIAAIEIGAVFAAMYLSWTQARQIVIEGVQGRYFIPVLPIVLILINKNIINLNIKNKCIKYIITMVVSYILILGFTVKAYLGI